MKLADNRDSYKISDKFEFRPDRPFHFRVIGMGVPKRLEFDRMFSFNPIFMQLTDNKDRYKSSDDFKFGPDQVFTSEFLMAFQRNKTSWLTLSGA